MNITKNGLDSRNREDEGSNVLTCPHLERLDLFVSRYWRVRGICSGAGHDSDGLIALFLVSSRALVTSRTVLLQIKGSGSSKQRRKHVLS